MGQPRAARAAFAIVLLGNAIAGACLCSDQSRQIARASDALRHAHADRRASVLVSAVDLAVSPAQSAKFVALAAIRDALPVIGRTDDKRFVDALLDAVLAAYPPPFPSADGDYASVFLSNQSYVERVRAGQSPPIAPDVLSHEIHESQRLLQSALRGRAGSRELRRLLVLLSEIDSPESQGPRASGAAERSQIVSATNVGVVRAK